MNNPRIVIEKTLKEFERVALKENVSDWQGNPTNLQNNTMLVQRDLKLTMMIPPDIPMMVDMFNPDLPWAEDHFKERVSGDPTNPGETYKYWPYHSNLENDKSVLNKEFSHTYQERFWPKRGGHKPHIGFPHLGLRFMYGDYNDVVELLINNPTTRQAYLPIWFPEDTWAANNSHRVPCTLGYYFYIVNGKLNCHYIIRSCDLYRHFRNDVYLTARLLKHTSDLVGVDIGNLTMTIFNLHLFVNDVYMFNKKEKAIYEKNYPGRVL